MSDKKPNQSRTERAAEAPTDSEHELELLTAENEQLKEELSREHEMHLRTLADFDNYRKRIERERTKAARAGKREIVLSMLDVVDDFERALKHIEESPESVSAGLRAIHRRLTGLLEAQGVTAFDSVGQPFDPSLHEAVATVESDEQEPGYVIDELSRGYRWGQELLRAARVRVSR
ncbi:MAG TPA: nucleotide exchange factor GrpE [Blastocatellia bacterium]|nr:nucleotide exchange factor GrpE [Blastocatellia bacterium]